MPRDSYYTTWGSVRGGCHHVHLHIWTADRCATLDHQACQEAGAYGDRSVRLIFKRDHARVYHPIYGPGVPVLAVEPTWQRAIEEARRSEG